MSITLREAIARRLVDPHNPTDPTTIATNLLRDVGDGGSETVHTSRRRFHALLVQAAELGIAQQVMATEAKARADAASFPPGRIREGLRRAWLVSLGIVAVIILLNPKSRFQPTEDYVVQVAVGTAFYALASWGVYRAVFWVWRGFRAT